jgi:hypothetical protein
VSLSCLFVVLDVFLVRLVFLSRSEETKRKGEKGERKGREGEKGREKEVSTNHWMTRGAACL